MAPAPIDDRDTRTPNSAPLAIVRPGLRDSGIQRSSRSPSACQLCLKATTTAVHSRAMPSENVSA